MTESLANNSLERPGERRGRTVRALAIGARAGADDGSCMGYQTRINGALLERGIFERP
jgi:hypothetical protein